MGTLYIGHTDSLGNRIDQHKRKIFPGFTAKYGCIHLVWYEEHTSRDEAFKRERQIKTWQRTWKIKMIEKENPAWLDIALLPTWPIPKGNLLDLSYARLPQ